MTIQGSSNSARPRGLQNAHPGLDLVRVFSRFKELKRESGNIVRFSRSELMERLGFAAERSGAGHTLVAAFVHFGLLEKLGSGYRYSRLANELGVETNSTRRIELLQEAALSPELYKKLYAEHKLDLPEDIAEKLCRSYRKRNINSGNVKQVLRNYVRSIEFAELATPEIQPRSLDVSNQQSYSPPAEDYVEINFLGTRTVVYKKYLREAVEKTQNRILETLK